MNWKDVVGYEGLYLISDTGLVKSIKADKIMSPFLHKKKWLKITLYKNGKSRHWRVHRLVAIAFIPNPDNKPEVNHISLNKQDNCISNLEWATGEENRKHYFTSVHISKTSHSGV
jgi:hypothetical protein